MLFKTNTPKLTAMEAVKLAFSVSLPFGMGFIHHREGEIEQEELDKISKFADENGGEINCDYVRGRMMKLYLTVEKDGISFSDQKPRFDYQSWCKRYPTHQDLFTAAEKSLKSKS